MDAVKTRQVDQFTYVTGLRALEDAGLRAERLAGTSFCVAPEDRIPPGFGTAQQETE